MVDLRRLARPTEEALHRYEGSRGEGRDPLGGPAGLGADVIFEPHKKPEPLSPPLVFGDCFGPWLDTYAKLACKEGIAKSGVGCIQLLFPDES